MIARLPLVIFYFLLFAGTGHLLGQVAIGGDRALRQRDPVLSVDGRTLYLSRPDHARNQGNDHSADVWVLRRKSDGSWGKSINPGSPINSFADDRPLHLSVDGNRIAVLRTGTTSTIELLERASRNWRLLQRWSLPGDVADVESIAFNANTLELVYVPSGRQMLYHRTALPAGQWGVAIAMQQLVVADSNSRPNFSPDGRTLYYRNGSRWMRETDRNETPRLTNISPRYLQLAITTNMAVAMTDDGGNDEQLYSIDVPTEDGIPAFTVTQATLGAAIKKGRLTAGIPLSSGVELAVLPDAAKRYALAVRGQEVLFSGSEVPRLSTANRAGGLAGRSERTDEGQEYYLQRRLDREEEALTRIDESRRQVYAAGSNIAAIDTLPPSATEATRVRYAKDLEDLEKMKEKFRQQQERKLRREDRGGFTPSTPPLDPSAERIDSTELRSGVRSGLFPDQRPAAYERRDWENNVGTGLPATAKGSGEESDRIDEAYEKKLREVEALRAQLQQARGGSAPAQPSAIVVPPGDLPPGSAAAPIVPPSGSAALSVTFISNTAYPNSVGYAGLDELVNYIKQASSVVDIRVHTGRELSARAAQLLSEERATTIRNYLTEAGIAAANFRVTGFGNNESAAGERVELLTAQ